MSNQKLNSPPPDSSFPYPEVDDFKDPGERRQPGQVPRPDQGGEPPPPPPDPDPAPLEG